MKVLFILGGLLVCAALGGVATAGAQPDLSTPEAAVRSFVKAFNSGKVTLAAKCVEGKPDAAALKEWEADWIREGAVTPQIELKDLKSEIKGTEATVAFTAVVAYAVGGTDSNEETLELVRVFDDWRIVPFSLDGLVQHVKQPDSVRPLKQFATFTAHPGFYLAAQESNRTDTCKSNLKRIGLGLLMLAQANNDKLALKANAFKAAANKYVRNEEVFYCPEHARTAPKVVSYAFNHLLEGKDPDALKNPERVVLAYEGRGGKLETRHDGKAGVVFADGHVEMLDAKAKLLWR